MAYLQRSFSQVQSFFRRNKKYEIFIIINNNKLFRGSRIQEFIINFGRNRKY